MAWGMFGRAMAHTEDRRNPVGIRRGLGMQLVEEQDPGF